MSKRKKKSGRRPGRGTLFVIVALLVGSGVIRLSSGASQAIAFEAQPEPAAELATGKPDPNMRHAEMSKLLETLKRREALLDKREKEVELRFQTLSIADRQIEEKLAALIVAEDNLRATIALADTAAEDDLTRLTSVYENMKPKDAAALFEEMDPEFAAGFLGRMRADSAAGIMAGLAPETAYTISVVLAGRNAGVPTE